MMNAKPDSKTKLFTKDVCINLDDIFNLNYLITNKFKSHYNNAGFIINVHVAFNNKKSLFFNSWQLFEQQKWIQSEPIDSILVKWEFNAELPGYKVPQKHTLIVKMSDGIKPEDMLKVMLSGGFDEIQELDKDAYPVIASVDFIDSTLGDELIAIVSNWVKSLNTCDTSSHFLQKLRDHKKKLSYFIQYFFTFTLALCCIKICSFSIEQLPFNKISDLTKTDFINLSYVIFTVVILFIVAKGIFRFVGRSVFEVLRDAVSSHTFNISNGDKKKQDENAKRYKKLKSSVVLKIIFSFIFNIICTIITTIITRVIL